MAFWRKRSFLTGALLYALVSIAIISFSSPLFRILGFEYSGCIALFSSLYLLFYSGSEAAKPGQSGIGGWARSMLLPVFILSSIPLAISLLSAFFIPNCSIADGILFYIEIVYPTALIAGLCGIAIGSLPMSTTRRNSYLALLWIASLVISLLPGYFTAKIYSYGWQYGYFPGFVWDEAIELHSAYWISRIIEVAMIGAWLIYYGRVRSKPIGAHRSWQSTMMIVVFILCTAMIGKEFVDLPIHSYLEKEVITGPIHIHYAPGSLSADELQLEKVKIADDVKEIEHIYGSALPSEIDIYVFPSTEVLYEYVGTREASISKPWRHALYIAKQNLRSLKHELAHVLLAKYGSYPFDISWSTGLTEGAAVAIEDSYDGLRSADELSARIIQMKLANGVAGVMKPSGFLSSAPSLSYVLSGSFTNYLLDRFGAERFLRVYKERDFDAIYREPLTKLESEWKEKLALMETPMDHYDSLRILYYFKRTSILREPCLRRIGKMTKQADAAFQEKKYALADSLYAIIERESGRIKAVRGRVLCQLHLGKPDAALSILDTTASAKETSNLAALHVLRGDVMVIAKGDIAKAIPEWNEAMKLELGDGYFTAAFMRLSFFGETEDVAGVQMILKDLYGLEEAKDKYKLVFTIEPAHAQQSRSFYKARLYLYVSYIERTGNLTAAYRIWMKGEKDIVSLGSRIEPAPEEKLFDRLMAQKYAQYPEAFGAWDQSSRSKTLPP